MTTKHSMANPKTSLLVLGFAAGVSQALLLREAMAALGGSELAWGTVMALWLAGMAVGSRLGVRAGGVTSARWLALATVILAGVGVVLFRAVPAITGAAPGETITTWHAVWLWLAAVTPAAVAGGLAFPVLADLLHGERGAGTAYGLEAAGALVGGLALSIFLAPAGTAAALSITAAAVVAANSRPRFRPLAALIAIGLVALSPFLNTLLARASWEWAGHPGELAYWTETRRQRIEVSSGPPTTLYADGRLVASYPDPYSAWPAGHLMMLLHPDPKRVFAVGCVTDGSIEAMIRHPVDEIIASETDPQLVARLPDWFGSEIGSVFANQRVGIRATDPIRTVADSGPFDLIVLRDHDPITIRHNRTRTREFFRLCRSSLADDGILALRLGVSDTYLGGAAGQLLTMFVSTLGTTFPKIQAIPGEQIVLLAGGPSADLPADVPTLVHRWHDRSIDDPVFVPEMIELLVDPDRAAVLNQTLRHMDGPLNTRQHPRAVLLAAGLFEARSLPAVLRLTRDLESRPMTLPAAFLGFAVVFLLVSAVARPMFTVAAGAVVGASSMGWWLVLMAAWQSTLGSVYAEVGALNASFMAGLAVGAIWSARRTRPGASLPTLLFAGACLSGVLATPILFVVPRVVVPALLLAGGVLTGAAFTGVAEIAGRGRTRRGAGIAFAADEAGAAIAALLIGTIAIPWAGISATAVGLAILGLSAVPAAIIARKHHK